MACPRCVLCGAYVIITSFEDGSGHTLTCTRCPMSVVIRCVTLMHPVSYVSFDTVIGSEEIE